MEKLTAKIGFVIAFISFLGAIALDIRLLLGALIGGLLAAFGAYYYEE